MRRRIRELTLEGIVEGVRRATDVARGQACDLLIQEELDQSPTVRARVESLRTYIGLASLDHLASPDDLALDQPLVEAFVRTHHHPEVLSEVGPLRVPGKPPAGPRLAQLASSRPDLTWDTEIVRVLLWRAIQRHGEHELDDRSPPWRMYWGPASGTVTALILLLTYEAFGSLDRTAPTADVALGPLEQQTVELARELVGAMARHDDPDVVARREAHARDKNARVGASLATFYVKTGQREGTEPLDRAIGKMLRYLAQRLQTDEPASASAAMNQPLPTLDDGSLVWLDVLALSSNRELVLRIRSPDGRRTTSSALVSVPTPQLIAFLEEPSAPARILAAIDELARVR